MPTSTLACLLVGLWAASPSPAPAPAASAARPADSDSAKTPSDTAKPVSPSALGQPGKGPRRDLLAERQERKLRVEYIKATAGIQGPTIKAEALLPLIGDTNLVLLDIRQPEEQAVSMIPGAMAAKDFAEKYRKGIPKGKRIVVYCTIGYRSGRYAMQLAAQGITAENLEGGVLAWSHVRGPFEVRNADGMATPTKRVHVWDKTWNYLHPDYQAVW